MSVDSYTMLYQRWEAQAEQIATLTARIGVLEAALRRCIDALEDLTDVQNGPPLISYTDAWNAAMSLSLDAICEARIALDPSPAPPQPAPCPECFGSGKVRGDAPANGFRRYCRVCDGTRRSAPGEAK